jgi:hypothetical protein
MGRGPEGDEPQEATREVVKVTMNVPVKVFEAWKWLSLRRGVSLTELHRQAISTEFFVETALSKAGEKPNLSPDDLPEPGSTLDLSNE